MLIAVEDTLWGREAALADVKSQLDRARAGRGGVTLIRGEAGIGKSAVLNAALENAGILVLSGRCPEGHHAPLHPLKQVAADAVGAGANFEAPGLSTYRRALAQLLPGIAADPSASDIQSPEWGVVLLGDALLALVRSVPRATVAVLAIEDVHWADRETWLALDHLSDRLARSPIAMLLTSRLDGERREREVQAMVDARRARAIDLGPLSRSDTMAMIAAQLGQQPPTPLINATYQFSEGNPFLVQEFLAASVSNGQLSRPPTAEHGDWTWKEGGAVSPPRRLVDAIAERWTRLSGIDQDLVALSAILARQIDIAVVANLSGVKPDGVQAALQQATQLRLVDQGDGLPQFHHALTNQAILSVVNPPRLSALAERALAHWRVADDRDSEVGIPLAIQAKQPGLAAELLLESARASARHGLVAGTLELISSARMHAVGQPDLLRDLALLEVRSFALAGEVEKAEAEGRALLDDPGLPLDDRRTVSLALARAHVTAGAPQSAAAILDDLPSELTVGHAATSSLRALIAITAGDAEGASDYANDALSTGDDEPEAQCEALLILGRVARGRDLAEAAAYFRRAVRTAERHGLLLWRASAMHEAATIDQLETLDISGLREARKAALDAGAPGLVSSIEFQLAAVLGVQFEVDEALATARRCMEAWHRLGAPVQEAYGWILIGQAHAAAAERRLASAAGTEAVRLAGELPEIAALAVGTCHGLASLLADDWPKARTEYAEAIALLSDRGPTPLPPWYLWPLIVAAISSGDDGDPAERFAEALALADHPGLRVSPGFDALWRLAEAVGFGRQHLADTASPAALDAFARMDALGPAFAGYRSIGAWLASSAAIDDGWGTPTLWLAEAGGWFESKGLARAAAGCRRQAARAGVRQRRRRSDPSSVPAALRDVGVTGREHEVLELVAAGMANAEIAAHLHIGVRTVKTHIEHLLAKTNTANRVQLVALVTQRDVPSRGI